MLGLKKITNFKDNKTSIEILITAHGYGPRIKTRKPIKNLKSSYNHHRTEYIYIFDTNTNTHSPRAQIQLDFRGYPALSILLAENKTQNCISPPNRKIFCVIKGGQNTRRHPLVCVCCLFCLCVFIIIFICTIDKDANGSSIYFFFFIICRCHQCNRTKIGKCIKNIQGKRLNGQKKKS